MAADNPIEGAAPNRTVWIDVEDLFDYARANPRPSGIQRLAFEIYSVLQARHGADGRVRFLRHDRFGQSFQIVAWETVAVLFARLTHAEEAKAGMERVQSAGPVSVSPAPGRSALRRGISAAIQRLPGSLRDPLIRFRVLQPAAIRALWDLVQAILRPEPTPMPASPPRPRPIPVASATATVTATATATGPAKDELRAQAKPGDVLLVLGAMWFHQDYGRLLRKARREYGMRTALLVYDLIPLRRPEWCHPDLVRLFSTWFASTISECDQLFAISRATAHDVELYARQTGIALPGPVQPVPIGTGFGLAAADAGQVADLSLLPPQLRGGDYALFVSTIEARKNHTLLFRVWRRLLQDLPRDRVPILVFAGRVGWLVADLMQQLENAEYLNGKVVIVRDPTDAELRTLYEGCLFTLFPSVFEGWGLPVTESLALGKPCVIANGTSLPEAGGTLARYFDPDNVSDAYRVIRATIEDKPGLAEWQARVAREFRPVPWDATADAILAGLDDFDALSGPSADQRASLGATGL